MIDDAFARPSAAQAHVAHAHAASAEPHEEHEPAGFREELRERVIGLGSMDRRLRLVVGAAIAQLVAAAIFVALRDVHFPSVIGDVTDTDTGSVQSTIPIATFVVATTFLTVAWAFILAGALHAHWTLRVVLFGLFGWAFAVESDTVSGTRGGMVAACALMAGILALLVASTVRDRKGISHAGKRLLGARLLLLIPLVGGLYITAWLSSSATDDLENFTTAVSQQLYYLQYALIPVLVLAGTDFADWGHMLGARAADAVRSLLSGWPLAVGTVAVAVAMLVDARRVLADDFAGELGLGAILVAGAALLAWLARPRGTWSARFPFLALAAVVVVDATVGFVLESKLSGDEQSVNDHFLAISAVMWAGLAILAAVALAVRRGRMRPALTAALAFVVLVGLSDVLFGLDSIASVFPSLHISGDVVPLDLDGARAVAAIATLAVVVAVVLTRRVRRMAPLVGALLALLVGVQVLAWVDSLFERTASAAEKITGGFSIAAAVILLLALLLEILGSGDAITNRDGRWLPRPARVLMYLGYVVLVASAVLYFASLHDPATGALRAAQFDSEEWVQSGVLFLGVPLVTTLFLGSLRALRQRPEHVEATPAALEASPAPAS